MVRIRPFVGAVVALGLATTTAAAADPIGGAFVDRAAQRLERHPRTFSVVATGDWLPEFAVNAAADVGGGRHDHLPLLEPIAAIVASADLAICHVETPIGAAGDAAGRRGRAPLGFTLLSAPHDLAIDLHRVGFDRCSTASNHSFDLGVDGIDDTLDALDAAGLSHVGTARSPEEAHVDVFPVGDVAVAHLAYTRTSNTGWPLEPWRIDRVGDADRIIADVAAARRAGAEVVIVSVHVFEAMQPAPSDDARTLVASVLTRSDVDLVVFHGPHVVQPLELVDGTPVFWSLGNLVSGMGVPGRGRYSDARTLDGLAASVRFTERPGGGFAAEARPVLLCQIVESRIVHPGLAPGGTTPLTDDERGEIAACVDRSRAVVAGLH